MDLFCLRRRALATPWCALQNFVSLAVCWVAEVCFAENPIRHSATAIVISKYTPPHVTTNVNPFSSYRIVVQLVYNKIRNARESTHNIQHRCVYRLIWEGFGPTEKVRYKVMPTAASHHTPSCLVVVCSLPKR